MNTSLVNTEPMEATIVEQLTRSEIDIQIATAKKYPRSIERFSKSALSLATSDVEVAMSCNYALPRDGKKIEGESIRLAEICAASFGNLRAYSRVIAVENKSVVAEGVCIDLETNWAVKAEVRRKIVNKSGKRYSEDMINMTSNAACSIALRNAIFKVIPLAYVKKIATAAKKVAIGDSKSLANRRSLMLTKFGELGVTKAEVLNKVGKAGDSEINLSDIEALIGIYSAITGGDTSVEEQFRADHESGTPTITPPKPKSGNARRTDPSPTVKDQPDGAPTPKEGDYWTAEDGTEYTCFDDGVWSPTGERNEPIAEVVKDSGESEMFDALADTKEAASPSPDNTEEVHQGRFATEVFKLASQLKMSQAQVNEAAQSVVGKKVDRWMTIPIQQRVQFLQHLRSLAQKTSA